MQAGMMRARAQAAGLASRSTAPHVPHKVVPCKPFRSAPRHVEKLQAAAAEAPSEAAVSQTELPATDEATLAAQAQAQAEAEELLLQQQILADELAQFELEELDFAQEQLLAWMTSKTEAEQEEDLDEAMDYDEFIDAEYEEIFPAVEQMVEDSYADIRIGDRVVGTVYEIDDDGAYVDVYGEKASGFVPLAECSFAKLKTPLEVLRVGMRREFVVVSKEDEAGQLVLSLAAIEASVFWERMRQMMTENTVVEVRVESANKGGLLVKYQGFDGFVPVGQFGTSVSVENMEDLVGKDLSVKFLDVDEEGERLVFSAKQANMISTPVQDIKMGQVVEGVVQVIKPYGVFVDIGGMSGLLHVSQISQARITSVEKMFKEGDRIKVMVLSADGNRGRITLTTKKLEPTPGDMVNNPQAVYESAEAMAKQFRDRIQGTKEQYTDAQAVQQAAVDELSDPNNI